MCDICGDDCERKSATTRDDRGTATSVQYLITKDGNSWCATGPGFENLMESPAAFGDTPLDALSMLFRQRKANDDVAELQVEMAALRQKQRGLEVERDTWVSRWQALTSAIHRADMSLSLASRLIAVLRQGRFSKDSEVADECDRTFFHPEATTQGEPLCLNPKHEISGAPSA